jgi:hypothetical protein
MLAASSAAGQNSDMHPGDQFARLHVAEPDRAFGHLQTLWRLLARRYAGRSPERLKAAASDRARWLRAVRGAAESRCIGWAHWDYADGFGFVRRLGDREIADEAIVRALLGGDSKPPQASSTHPLR